MKEVRNALLITIVIVMAATAFFTAGLIAGSFGGYRVITATFRAPEAKDAKAEYYRGVYDICLQQTHKIDFCLDTVQKMTNDDWYEKPSSGWEWPLTINDPVAQTE